MQNMHVPETTYPNDAIKIQDIHVQGPTLCPMLVVTLIWQSSHLVVNGVSLSKAYSGGLSMTTIK